MNIEDFNQKYKDRVFDNETKISKLRKESPDVYSDIIEIKEKYNIPDSRIILGQLITRGRFDLSYTCCVCDKHIDGTKSRLAVCSNGCSQKLRWSDEQHREKMKKIFHDTQKERVRSGKAREASIKAANTLKSDPEKLRKRNENIKKTKKERGELRRKRKEEIEKYLNNVFAIRIQNIKLFGKFRLLIKISCAIHDLSFYAIVNRLSDHLPNDFDYQHEFALFHGLYNSCETCGKQTRNLRFCSRECVNNDQRKEEISERMKNIWKDDNYRNNQIEKQKNRWSKCSEEERSEWARKVLDTLGEDGRKLRSKKLVRTRYNKAQIAVIKDEIDTEYKEYKRAVSRFTNQARKKFDSVEFGKHTYHLDHIFPTSKGFIYGIPPDLIGSEMNLQVLPADYNRKKSNEIQEIPSHIEEYIKENQIHVED